MTHNTLVVYPKDIQTSESLKSFIFDNDWNYNMYISMNGMKSYVRFESEDEKTPEGYIACRYQPYNYFVYIDYIFLIPESVNFQRNLDSLKEKFRGPEFLCIQLADINKYETVYDYGTCEYITRISDKELKSKHIKEDTTEFYIDGKKGNYVKEGPKIPFTIPPDRFNDYSSKRVTVRLCDCVTNEEKIKNLVTGLRGMKMFKIFSTILIHCDIDYFSYWVITKKLCNVELVLSEFKTLVGLENTPETPSLLA